MMNVSDWSTNLHGVMAFVKSTIIGNFVKHEHLKNQGEGAVPDFVKWNRIFLLLKSQG